MRRALYSRGVKIPLVPPSHRLDRVSRRRSRFNRILFLFDPFAAPSIGRRRGPCAGKHRLDLLLLLTPRSQPAQVACRHQHHESLWRIAPALPHRIRVSLGRGSPETAARTNLHQSTLRILSAFLLRHQRIALSALKAAMAKRRTPIPTQIAANTFTPPRFETLFVTPHGGTGLHAGLPIGRSDCHCEWHRRAARHPRRL